MTDCAGHLVTGITNGFQFAYLTKYHAGLILCLVRQVLIAHLFEIIRNLYFHVVGDGLITFDTCILTFKLLLVLLIYQCACHPEHAMHTLGKMYDFLLCLQYSNFWRLYHTTTDEVQRRGLFGFLFVFWHKFANDLLHLRNQADEQSCIKDIETGVEHGQHNRNPLCLSCHRRIVAYKAAHQIDKRIEHGEHPDDTENVEQQVSQSCASCLSTSTKGCKICCCRRSDILAHHQGDTHIDRQYTR